MPSTARAATPTAARTGQRLCSFVSPAERDQAVNDLIALVAAIDSILQAQSASDADYFIRIVSRSFSVDETAQIKASVLSAYRWQYIISGVQHPTLAGYLRA